MMIKYNKLPKKVYIFGKYIYKKLLLPIRMIIRKILLIGFRKIKQKNIKFENLKFKLFIDPKNGWIDENIYLFGFYEINTAKELIKNLNKNSTFLDIGSNIGIFSNLCGKYLENGEVLAFEPIKKIYKQNKKSLEINKLNNVKLYNLGCGLKKQQQTIFINRYNVGGSTLIKSCAPKNTIKEKISIIKLDDFLPKDKKIDLVKIDVEGFEYQVLLGMKSIIKKYKPTIIMEFSLNKYDALDNNIGSEILELLASFNYSIKDFDNNFKINSFNNFISYLRENKEIDHINLICK